MSLIYIHLPLFGVTFHLFPPVLSPIDHTCWWFSRRSIWLFGMVSRGVGTIYLPVFHFPYTQRYMSFAFELDSELLRHSADTRYVAALCSVRINGKCFQTCDCSCFGGLRFCEETTDFCVLDEMDFIGFCTCFDHSRYRSIASS